MIQTRIKCESTVYSKKGDPTKLSDNKEFHLDLSHSYMYMKLFMIIEKISQKCLL